MIKITNDQGRCTGSFTPAEPNPGSVVLVGGPLGNAYQLYASDGLWHRGRQAVIWDWLLCQRNLVLVHSTPSPAEIETLREALS